jgi:hypothetical protein
MTLEESNELQAIMALDDAGISAEINRKGQVVVKKKDLKKAEKALKKSFKKGGEPKLVGEETIGDVLDQIVVEAELEEASSKKARNKAADEIEAIADKGGAEAPALFSLASKLRKGTHSTTGLKLSKQVTSILKANGIKEEDELNERKYNWAVIDTADKNRVQALTSDEKGARDSVKSSTTSKYDYHYGKDPKTLKVVKLKKTHKDDDIGDPLKESLREAAPANSVAGGNVNLDPFKKKRKNAKVQTEMFAGQKVFVVSPERFYESRLGKSRYSRYEKYVGNDKLGEAIRQYGRNNPKNSIILKNSGNGAMLYLKYGRQ